MQIKQADGTYFYLPNKTLLGNKFIKGNALKDINLLASIKLSKTQIKDYPEIDAFYCDKSVTVAKGLTSIDFSLLRTGFGATFNVDTLATGKVLVFMGNDTITITSVNKSATTIRQFNIINNTDLTSIFNNSSTFGDSILVKVQWVGTNGITVNTQGKFKFLRNYMKTINIQLNTSKLNLNFEGWANSVTDIDGNGYQTVTIGTQTWMAENLKVTHYRDGTVIPNVTSATSWAALTTGAYCDYANSTTNGTIYGHLYNWYTAIDSRNISPAGWHVPTDAEWKTLENYLIANGYNYDGTKSGNKIAKSLASTVYWMTDTSDGSVANDVSKNNKSGFSGLPAGYRYDINGNSYGLGGQAIWWSSTNLYNLSIGSDKNMSSAYIDANSLNGYKHYGFSIRCIKD